MIRSVTTTILSVVAILILLDLATTSDRHSEINRATGAMRTRTTRALIFKGGWKEHPTWLSERAKELGFNGDHEWQHLTRLSTAHFFLVTRACGSSPASYQIRNFDPEELTLEQQDQFVARFVQGTEEERENLIRRLADGDLPVP